jgi:DNA adenine methylase
MTTKKLFFPFETMIKTPSKDDRTPLIYYGGKSRDADWIISNFPAGWSTLVDVFGGGGAISFRVGMRGKTIVYNDIGNVCHFMKVLRDDGDELYRRLYFTPYSREEFDKCRDNWYSAMLAYKNWTPDITDHDLSWYGIEWARKWYTTVAQGYTHEEHSDSWKNSATINMAESLANHVDDLPRFTDRLRRMIIENSDFSIVILQYDRTETLFYCDPPYIHDTRITLGAYEHEMSIDRHLELLMDVVPIKGQAIVSGYSHPLYEEHLKGWRRVEKTAKSAIQNASQIDGRNNRTEVLWIKEHSHGLWT